MDFATWLSLQFVIRDLWVSTDFLLIPWTPQNIPEFRGPGVLVFRCSGVPSFKTWFFSPIDRFYLSDNSQYFWLPNFFLVLRSYVMTDISINKIPSSMYRLSNTLGPIISQGFPGMLHILIAMIQSRELNPVLGLLNIYLQLLKTFSIFFSFGILPPQLQFLSYSTCWVTPCFTNCIHLT